MIDLKPDHIGVIVKNIEKEKIIYESLGFVCDSEIFQDNNQQMRGVFLRPTNEVGYRVELIEDLSESQSLNKILNNRCGKIYHIAFKVDDLEKNINEILEQLNAKILSPIKSGEYYAKVCFIFLSNAQIVELVEYK